MYSNEKNAQIIVSLLKAHNIKFVVASPGNTNYGVVGSLQGDPFFSVFFYKPLNVLWHVFCGCQIHVPKYTVRVEGCTVIHNTSFYEPVIYALFDDIFIPNITMISRFAMMAYSIFPLTFRDAAVIAQRPFSGHMDHLLSVWELHVTHARR